MTESDGAVSARSTWSRFLSKANGHGRWIITLVTAVAGGAIAWSDLSHDVESNASANRRTAKQVTALTSAVEMLRKNTEGNRSSIAVQESKLDTILETLRRLEGKLDRERDRRDR